MASQPQPVSAQAEEMEKLAAHVFDDLTYALDWLNEPNLALGNRSPKDVLSKPEGIEVVRNLLLRIQYGVLA